MTKKELRQFLEQHSREQLADWLMTVAKDAPDFRQRLELYVATHHSFAHAAQAIQDAVDRFGALNPHRAPVKLPELIKQGRFLLESLRACFDFEPGPEFPDMVEKCMTSFDQFVGRLGKDDNRLLELQREFATLYERVVTEFPMPAAELGEKLFHLRERSLAQMLPDAPRSYMKLLGAEGLARYRELLGPTLEAVIHGEGGPWVGKRQTRRQMVFEWATITEDIDEQVAILLAMSRRPDEVLIVANYLISRQRPMDALDIVRQAQQRHANPKLAVFLADQLEKQNQAEQALPYRWYLFEQKVERETYDDLMRDAAQCRQVAHWRERATPLIAEKNKGLGIELMLEEDRLEEALTEARQHGARLSLWVRMAEGYALRDPKLAIELYFDCAEFALKERATNNHIELAWALAVDGATFQVFNARLRSLFSRVKVAEREVTKLVAAGIPVAKLLGSLSTQNKEVL